MNPLQKYFRQPKIYISLPSKGNYYPEESLAGDYTNVPIFAMTGMDELIMKTPDALFNGEATVKLIESCCPYIKNANSVPSLDVDTILASIRIATFGDNIAINHRCTKCESINDYDISAQTIIDHYSSLTFDNKKVLDNMTIFFRPLSYGEMTAFNIDNFTLQKMLTQLNDMVEYEDRQSQLDQIYQKLAMIQASVFVASIEGIQIEDTMVTDYNDISEWIGNCDKDYYDSIKTHLENNKKVWDMPKSNVICPECNHEELTSVALDQSHFFA